MEMIKQKVTANKSFTKITIHLHYSKPYSNEKNNHTYTFHTFYGIFRDNHGTNQSQFKGERY